MVMQILSSFWPGGQTGASIILVEAQRELERASRTSCATFENGQACMEEVRQESEVPETLGTPPEQTPFAFMETCESEALTPHTQLTLDSNGQILVGNVAHAANAMCCDLVESENRDDSNVVLCGSSPLDKRKRTWLLGDENAKVKKKTKVASVR